MYALCEDLPIILEDVVTCDAFPSEAQLAAILGQVILLVFIHPCLQRRLTHSRCSMGIISNGKRVRASVFGLLKHTHGS
jgi:hypothetical protein